MFLVVASLFIACDAFVGVDDSKTDALDLERAFDYWKTTHGKTYPTIVEEDKRFSIFVNNYHLIHSFNARPHQTVVLGLNQFADLTFAEFKAKFLLPRSPARQHQQKQQPQIIIRREDEWMSGRDRILAPLPPSVDWSNVTKPVANQGQCGSSWAFPPVYAIQARWAMKSGRLDQLSVQQIIDCDKPDKSYGCNGGFMDTAFQYTKKNGGLCLAKDYPYTAKDGQCRTSQCKPIDPIRGYKDVPKKNTRAMMEALLTGPVSTAIEADQEVIQFYHSGIITGNCSARLEHGILIVGYGTENGQDYWKLQNTWGSGWGEQGCVRLCRNCHKNHGAGQCGLLEEGSYPLI